jgi:hypothetical protein
MPSTYTNNLGIELPGDGELDGVWGDVVNTNMSILDRAINGSVSISLTGTSSTLTTTDGTLSNGQYKLLVLTGSPSGTHTITIAPNDAAKIYFVYNTTAQSVVFTQGSGGNVTIAAGDSGVIYSNGGGASAAVVNLTDHFAMSSVNITGGTISGVTSIATTTGSFGLGAVATPSITFTGDLNTGMWSPAADTVAVSTAGTERLRIDSSGNVGIGTSSPDSSLDIRSSVNTNLSVGRGSGQGKFSVYGPSGTNSLEVIHNGSAAYVSQVGGSSGLNFRNTTGDYSFSTGVSNTERMRIDAAGNVGIGTASPVSIGGHSGVLNLYGSNATALVLQDAASRRDIRFNDGVISVTNDAGTSFATLDPAGNLGLGVTPSAWGSTERALQIGNTLSLNRGGSSEVWLGHNTYVNSSGQFIYNITSTASRYEQLLGQHRWFNAPSGTAGNTISFTQAMTLDASGNLGLGGTPNIGGYGRAFEITHGNWGGALTAQALDVDNYPVNLTSNAVSSGAFAWKYMNSASATRYEQATGSHRWFTAPLGTAGSVITFAERMRIDASGNVGIGTSVTTGALLNLGGTTVSSTQAILANGVSDINFQLYAGNGLAGVTSGTLQASFGLRYSTSGDTAAFKFYRGSGARDGAIGFNTDNLERMRLDSNGNLGLGVTPSAWSAGNTALQIGNSSHIAGVSALTAATNYYYDSADKYYGSGSATKYIQVAGAHSWYTAPSGTAGAAITFTQAMTLDASGNLGLGITNPAYKLVVSAGGASGIEFGPAYSGTANLVQHYSRSGGVYVDAVNDAAQHRFSTAGTERMRIDASGNVGIGTASGTGKLEIGVINFGASQAANGITIKDTSDQFPTMWTIETDGLGVPTIRHSFITEHYLVYRTNNGPYLGFGVTGTERMRLDSNGNLGLGVTPSAWQWPAFQTQRASLSGGANDRAELSYNYFRTSGVNTYIATDFASSYNQLSGQHRWFTAPSGTAGNPITFTQAMTLDASGNLGLGVTPNAYWNALKVIEVGGAGAVVASASAGGAITIAQNAYFDPSLNWRYRYSSLPVGGYDIDQGVHKWRIAPSGTAGAAITFTQAMTLDASGSLLIGTTSKVNTEKLSVYGDYTAFWNASYTGFIGAGSSLAFTGAASDFAIRSDSNLLFTSGGGTERMRIDSSGDVLIGTTSNDGRLTVKSASEQHYGSLDTTSADSGYLALKAQGSIYGYLGQASTLAFGGAGTDTALSSLANLVFVTDGLERARISTAGNLSVTGSFSLPLGAVGTPSLTFTGDTDTGFWSPGAGIIAASLNGVEEMRLISTGMTVGGNVTGGSQTVAGTYVLRLHSGTADSVSLQRYSSGLSEVRNSAGALAMVTTGADPVIISTTNAERMRIFSTGGVSIGNTTDPGATNLSVTGAITTGGNSVISARGATNTAVQSLDYAGITATADDDGTFSTGTYTPTPVGGNFKRIVNGGAFTLAEPSAAGDYTLVIQITNTTGAGAITMSGFDKVTGDAFTTTDGNDFFVFVTKCNGFTSANVQALQ